MLCLLRGDVRGRWDLAFMSGYSSARAIANSEYIVVARGLQVCTDHDQVCTVRLESVQIAYEIRWLDPSRPHHQIGFDERTYRKSVCVWTIRSGKVHGG